MDITATMVHEVGPGRGARSIALEWRLTCGGRGPRKKLFGVSQSGDIQCGSDIPGGSLRLVPKQPLIGVLALAEEGSLA